MNEVTRFDQWEAIRLQPRPMRYHRSSDLAPSTATVTPLDGSVAHLGPRSIRPGTHRVSTGMNNHTVESHSAGMISSHFRFPGMYFSSLDENPPCYGTHFSFCFSTVDTKPTKWYFRVSQYLLPTMTGYTRSWTPPCGAHPCNFSRMSWHQDNHRDATSRCRWATQSTRRVSENLVSYLPGTNGYKNLAHRERLPCGAHL